MNESHRSSKRLNIVSLLLQCVLLAALCAVVAVCWQVYHQSQQTGVDAPGSPAAVDDPSGATEGTSSGETEPVVSPVVIEPNRGAELADAADPDQGESHLTIHGTWQDDYQGKRTMTLRPDGTGTMVVELEGLNATLFASRLTFEMTWSLDGDRLKKHTIGGEPKGKVRAVLAMMGDKVEEEIIELTDERLLVSDGKQQFDWRRVPE